MPNDVVLRLVCSVCAAESDGRATGALLGVEDDDDVTVEVFCPACLRAEFSTGGTNIDSEAGDLADGGLDSDEVDPRVDPDEGADDE